MSGCCRHEAVYEACGEGGSFGMCMGTRHNEVDHGKGKLYVFKYFLQVHITRKSKQ